MAAAVLAMHGLGLLLFLTVKQTVHVSPERVENPTWITLPPIAPKPILPIKHQTIASPLKPRAHAKANPLPSVQPSLPSPTVPQVPSNAGLAALQPYVTCGLLDDSRASAEDRERCGKLRRELYNEPTSPHVPTERQRQLALKFEHEKAVEDSPITVPCFDAKGIGFSVGCIVKGIANGFDFSLGSYADVSEWTGK